MSAPIVQTIHRWIQERRDAVASVVSELVQIPSINHPPTGDERLAQNVIAGMLRRLGCEVDCYDVLSVPGIEEHPAWRPGRDYTGRPNVMARLEGRGAGNSLVLSGHIDTVGITGEPWEHDPFGGDFDGESVYGLGAFDMKGGLAAAYMALWCLVDLGIELRGDLYLESVVNEEYGGATGTLAGRLSYPHIDGAILMEPTNLRLATSHRGGIMWRIRAQGQPGRSFSGEHTANPIFPLCAILQDLEAFNRERNEKRRQRGLVEPLPIEISQLKAGPVEWEMGERVPNEAWATLWVETDPDDDLSAVGDAITGFLSSRRSLENVRFTPIIPPLPGSGIPHDAPLSRTVAGAMRDIGLDATPVTAPFACDGAMFNQFSSTPMLLLGPAGGNAHAHDEWVSVASVQRLAEVLATTAVRWCQE